MRDAFGGTFLTQIFLVFILIYICFTAVSINYAKAFKVKNKVIEYLETNEISNLNDMNALELESLKNFIDNEILGNMNYNVSDIGVTICNNTQKQDDSGKIIAICDDSGIKIEQVEIKQNEKNTEGVYYTVTTYVGWGLPFLNTILKLNGNNEDQDTLWGVWKISGQTRLIVNK